MPVRASMACTTLHDAVTIHDAVDHDRRRFDAAGGLQRVAPHQSELFDVVGIDLVELGKTRFGVVETDGRPVVRGRGVGLDRGAVDRRSHGLDMIRRSLGLRERAAAEQRRTQSASKELRKKRRAKSMCGVSRVIMSSQWSLMDLQGSYACAKQRVNQGRIRGVTNTKRLRSFDFRRTERPHNTRIGKNSTAPGNRSPGSQAQLHRYGVRRRVKDRITGAGICRNHGLRRYAAVASRTRAKCRGGAIPGAGAQMA